MKRYAIWDKQTPIITPSMEVFSAEEWMKRYPVAAVDGITVICSAGEINGGFFGTLGQLVDLYDEVIDFSVYTTPEEKLVAIEDYENQKAAEASATAAAKAEQEAMNAELNATSLASIAASMEFQNLMSLPDEEEI